MSDDTLEVSSSTPGRILAVLVDQGGAVTKVDGSGARLVRGGLLAAIRRSLPHTTTGSTIHIIFTEQTGRDSERFFATSKRQDQGCVASFDPIRITAPLLTELKALWSEG